MNSSQIPPEPKERIGWIRPSHELKSPTTLTARAAGAQTANAVPATGGGEVNHADRAPGPADQLPVAPLADQVQVELAKGGREPVRILDREHAPGAVVDLEPVVER